MMRVGGLEGLGGPVNVTNPNFDDIDPTMESCCQREIEDGRKMRELKASLAKHDIARIRERQRRNLITPDACRCCFDPAQDGGEYRALMELKQQQQRENGASSSLDERENQPPESDDDSDDDEFDYLLDDDLPDDEERKAELEWAMLQTELQKFHGYGLVRQMHPARVLSAANGAPFCVLHLLDADSRASASLDLFLEQTLAPKMPGTLFLRSPGRATILLNHHSTEWELLLDPNRDLPALVAMQNGRVVRTCLGLRELVDPRENSILPSAVTSWLEHNHVLSSKPVDQLCRIRPEEQALTDSLAQRYDCGVEGCFKSFPHQHVGLSTRLISEEEVLGRPLGG